MKRFDIGTDSLAGTSPAGENRGRTTILAVGDVEEWRRHGGRFPVDGKLAFTSFDAISRELFDTISPSIVLSPLLARGFDCVDLAQLLFKLRFSGRYLAISDELPDPGIIRREIAILCPGLNFDLISLAGPGLRHN